MKLCKEPGCENLKADGRSRCFSCYGRKRRAKEAIITPKAPDGKMRVLMVDIETIPDRGYFWGIFNQNIGISQISDPGGMVCFAAKWYGQDEIEFYSEWGDGNLKMVLEAWRLLDEADVVVTFYGSRFDVPHFNTEFLKNGFPPPSPFKQIDLKMAVGKQFKFTSNKLQFVSRVLGLEGKEEHEGFPMWDKLMNETRRNGERPFTLEVEEDAKARMEIYNKRDVFLLDEVYEALLPWLPTHPHRHLYEAGRGCPACGADADFLVDAGYYYTNLSKFQQYRCQICERYFRSNKREMGVKVQDSML